jgi:isopenicillin N synthase-like dioxygenase
MACDIPIVDISAWSVNAPEEDEANRAVTEAWNVAMREYGCAVIIGHGIEESAFDQINQECREFFAKDVNEKQQYNHGAYGSPLGGYTAPGNEIVALSSEEGDVDAKLDPVENFVFTSHPSNYKSPSGSSAPFSSVCAYYESMERTLKTIHSLSCAALGVADLSYFQQFYDAALPGNEAMGMNGNALRLAHYPPINPASLHGKLKFMLAVFLLPYCLLHPTATDESTSAFDDKVRYGAHTDYQGFTILRPDKSDWHIVEVPAAADHHATGAHPAGTRVQCGGLEVFHRGTGRWVQVRIPKELNALVVNAGDLIQRWTADYWHSPLHRVVTFSALQSDNAAPSASSSTVFAAPNTALASGELHTCDSAALSRQAIVFFTGPLENCLIESLDAAVMRNVHVQANGEGEPLKSYPPIRSGDHLLMKLNKTNLTQV